MRAGMRKKREVTGEIYGRMKDTIFRSLNEDALS